MTSNYVLYHGGGCLDGIAAAAAAYLCLRDTAIYRACNYYEGGAPLEDIPDEASVLVLDFSFKKEVIEKHIDRFTSFKLLDHHKTAEEDLAPWKDDSRIVFDMNKSGCILAWEYFHPGWNPPELLLHVQDRDLWQFKLLDTKVICAALSLEPKEVKHWAELLSTRHPLTKLREDGLVILRHQQHLVAEAVRHAFDWTYDGHKAKAVCSSVFQSEIGNALVEAYPEIDFAMVYTVRPVDGKDWTIQIALRGDKSRLDTSAISAKFGGGGHHAASGHTRKMHVEFYK